MVHGSSEAYDSNVFEFLNSEISRSFEMIRTITAGYERWMAASTAIVVGGGVTLGLRDGGQLVLILLPLPVLIVILLAGSNMIELNAQAGYKHYLEELATGLLNTKIALWESNVAKEVYRTSVTNNVLLPGSYLVAYLTVLGASFVTATGPYESWRYGVVAFAGCSFAVLGIVGYEIKRAHSSAHDAAAAFSAHSETPSCSPEPLSR